MEKYNEVLKANLFLQAFKKELETATSSDKPYPKLVGGAVVDILNGRVPKDYDFLHSHSLEQILRKNLNFKLAYTSGSAITFIWNNSIIQLLYKSVDDFPYTLEQGTYNLNTDRLEKFDEQSFLNKILVPSDNAFERKTTARAGIKRLLHWQHKGFKMENITFQSLLKVAFKECKGKNGSNYEDDEES